jgi:hypothetical protein
MVMPFGLQSMGLVYSTTLISTTFVGGAFAILLPIGLARGFLSSVQDVVETSSQQAIQQVMQGGNNNVLSQDSKAILERLTLGSGWQGQVLRTVANPFLPSTAQMLVRMQEAIDTTSSTSTSSSTTTTTKSDKHGQMLAAAASGFVEGFIQDKKDTITMLGSLAYMLVLGVGFGVDYTYRKADEKRTDMKETTQQNIDNSKQKMKQALEPFIDKMQQATEGIQQTKEQVEGQYQIARDGIETKQAEMKESMQEAQEQIESRYQITKDAAETNVVELKRRRELYKSRYQGAKEAAEVNVAELQDRISQLQEEAKDSKILEDARKELEQIQQQAKEVMSDDDRKHIEENVQAVKDKARTNLEGLFAGLKRKYEGKDGEESDEK